MMSDAKIVITILFSIIFFLYLVNNLISLSNVELYVKKYDELKRGVYKYEPSPGIQSDYFYLYSYDINTVRFTKTNVAILFFLDGDIKLTNNLYICKSDLFMSLVSWYYWRKFQKLKDELIVNYERGLDVRQIYDRAVELERKKNKLEFKFLRG
jgi:hypothetical protein